MTAPSVPKAKRKSKSFMQPVQPDEKLAAVVGHQTMPRTEITRKLWEYIHAHRLQNATNKMFINADDKLREIFGGRDRVSMFEMTRLVFSHVRQAA
jgi:upstream activation factor subunit UAF30